MGASDRQFLLVVATNCGMFEAVGGARWVSAGPQRHGAGRPPHLV